MTRIPRLRTDRAPLLLLILPLCVAGLLAGAGAGFAQTCSDGSPAKIAGQSLWGSLRPGDVFEGSALNDLRDSTDYTGNNLPNNQRPLYLSLDIENGWVFTSYASGFRIWDANANAEKPPSAGMLDLRTGSGCNPSGSWPQTPFCTELKHFFWDIDAPAGIDTIFAMSGITPVGLSIVKSTDKANPQVVYQDTGKGSTPAGSQVYAATLGGRHYAFAVFNQGSSGIFLYDMTSASSLNKCAENSDTEAGKCPGVFKSRIGSGVPTIYIDGVGTASGKHYIVASSQSFSGPEKGVEIWDVTNPLAPANVHSSSGRFLTNQFTSGVAMWEQGGQQYLATHVEGGAQIFNVTSCLANGCSSLGNPIWTGSWSTWGKAPVGAERLYVTFSRSGTKPMLYFGSTDQCSGGLQREFVFDVSNASAPVEITPAGTQDVNGKQVDYWGWYYSGNNPSTGFSRVMPMVAKFSGAVLYRAAQTVFDTHVWTNAAPTPPNANFTWSPTTVYRDQTVTFNDTSTGNVTSRQWSFPPDAQNVSSTTGSPVTLSFSSTGTKPVTLTATNGAGSTPKTLNVEVLDPTPAFGAITHNPPSPQTCQKVTFTPTATGFPAPTVKWVVKDQGGTQVYPQLGEASAPFELPANTLAANAYTAVFSATNTAGTVTSDPHAFTISNPPALSFTGAGGAPLCTNCTSGTPPFGTVILNASATGATGYSWDFGDGVFRGQDNGQALFNTATPTFVYTSTGQKVIRAKIHGCSGELVSQNLTVTINNVNPLKINKFEAICAFAPCGFGTNVPINFEVDLSGDPDDYHFDWDGNGTFEDTATTPSNGLVTHTYTAAGTYRPVMKILRGTESQTSPQHFPIAVSGGDTPRNPSISINGPTSGQPNASLTFSASASNCTPAATWTWNLGGGTATGSTTGSSVTIAWASSGSKSISVTNSGCSGASDSHTVTIGESQPPPGNLTANFSWTPNIPNPGQAVSFDAGSSTGSPTVYTWDFGGGVLKSGKNVTHTFAAPGPYTVKLEVGKPGDCALGFCSAGTSKQVTVAGPPPIAASFNTSANCVAEFGPAICTATAGQEVSFTSTSTGNPTTFAWAFGDGGTASGATATHTFQQAGTFTVTLTVGKDANTSTASRTFNVSPGAEEPLAASYNTSAACTGNTCSAEAGQELTFTSTSKGNPTSQSWNFGDGGTANGASATHTFQQAGAFTVTLTIGKGANTHSTSRTFNVTGGVVEPESGTIILPWAAQSRGVLQQSSNMYIHNPGTTPLEVTLEFRRQGIPEANPPRAALTIQPGATQYVVDVLKGLFKVENTVGFVTITKTKGDRDPVMTSFNNIAGKKGAQYGQAIPGVRVLGAGAAATTGTRVQNLVGLSDNGDRQAYFGITNPNPQQAVYRLKFYDSLGRPIGTPSGDLTLPSFGQRQYQLSEIRTLFGISTEDDYRVEVETVSGGTLYPYGTNVQTVSKDPTYQGIGRSKSRLYLIGAMHTKGLNKSEWQSDVVLANTGTEVALADVSFLNAGPTSQLTSPITLTLQPGQTERLENVGRQWNVNDAVGLLVIESDAPDEVFPIVQGESYLATNGKAGARYGLSMAAFTDEDAAEAGEAHYLVGLRHDANNRSTIWLVNPTLQVGTYDLIYRGLDGKILGRLDNVTLGGAKMRQIGPTQHPLKAVGKKKAAGVPGGFTVQIVVKSGKALAAAQVVNNKTNDPAYVQGETR